MSDLRAGMRTGLVTIAGYDPSGGAGALLDVAVFERLGFAGAGVLTAITAQDAERVFRVLPVPARHVEGQFRALKRAAPVAGIKVGMLGTRENLEAVAVILARNNKVPRVVDPVLRSTSGAPLLRKAAWPRFLDAFEMNADLITPNLYEAEVLTGRPVRNVGEMTEAAAWIWHRTGLACLVKGGHLEGKAVDVLFDDMKVTLFPHPRVAKNVHGTGCFLSAAILAFLARGKPLAEACGRAVEELQRGLEQAVPATGGRWVFRFNRSAGPERPPARRRR